MARNKLIEWEKESGYHTHEIAEMLDIASPTWSNIKSGRKNPTYKTLSKFQKRFKPKDIITLFSEE